MDCANNTQYTENNKQCQKCKLSSLEWLELLHGLPLVLWLFLQKALLHTSLSLCCSSHHGKWFPSVLNETTCFHMHICISEIVIHYVVGIRLFYLAPVRNTLKTCNSWLVSHITIQPLTPVVNLKGNIILNCITSHNHKEDIYKSSVWC